MSVNRDELFKKSSKTHIEEKKERDDRKNFSYDPIDYTSLEKGFVKVFRLLGLPPNLPEGLADPFSPKIINISMVLADNDKKMRVIWPLKKDDDSWILWKIYDLVKDYDWDTRQDKPIYKYEKTHPTLFNRVHKNNDINNTYEKGWLPKTMVIFNCLDRDRMDWHHENKKTFLLAKKASERTDGSFYYTAGIPFFSCYDKIVEEIQELNGDWENYDVGIEALDKEPWYRVYHIEDDLKRLQKLDEPRFGSKSLYLKYMNQPLTEEELSWQRWDISKMFQISSYQKIKKRLGKFIALVDEIFNKHFSEELDMLVEKEKEEFAKRADKKDEENMDYIDKREEEEKRKTQVVKDIKPYKRKDSPPTRTIEKEQRLPVRGSKSVKGQLEELEGRKIKGKSKKGEEYTRFVGVINLVDTEIQNIINIDIEQVIKFQYTPEAGQIYECDYCQFESPLSFAHCPDCGKKFN